MSRVNNIMSRKLTLNMPKIKNGFMRHKFIWASVAILILAGTGVYFGANRQPPPRSRTITNFEECARAGYPVGESYPRQCWMPKGRHFVEGIEPSLAPTTGSITVPSEMTCLPKTGQGAQTLECAMGLKGKDGRYYELKNLSRLDPEYKFSVVGLLVEVSGTFSPEVTKGPDGNTYGEMGVIDVTSIKKVGN